MKKLQPTTKPELDTKKLADDIAALISSRFDDSILLKIAERIMWSVAKPDNPDAVYKEFPTVTQFVTEENFRLGAPYKLPYE